MPKISSYTQLCIFIRELSKHKHRLPFPLILNISDLNATEESILNLYKLKNKYPESLSSLLETGNSEDVFLLSNLVGHFPGLFSTKEVYTLPNVKLLAENYKLRDMYKCFRTYVNAFNVFFEYDEDRQTSMYTRLMQTQKQHPHDFLVREFPIAFYEEIDGSRLGKIENMVDDLIAFPLYGLDYLYSWRTGEFIAPIHTEMVTLENRLLGKMIREEFWQEVEEEADKQEKVTASSLDVLGILNPDEKQRLNELFDALPKPVSSNNKQSKKKGRSKKKPVEEIQLESEPEQPKQEKEKSFISNELKRIILQAYNTSVEMSGANIHSFIEDGDDFNLLAVMRHEPTPLGRTRTKAVPHILYLGKSFNSPCFGFGRVFTKHLASNVLNATYEYGRPGAASIKEAYKSLERKYLLEYNNTDLSRGIVYDTYRFSQKLNDQNSAAIYEKRFNPPKKFLPSLKHFVNTPMSPTIGKTLAELTMEDIVLIFPLHELHILKLAVGRILIGTSGSREYMNPNMCISHDWRKAVITVGAPKIGKSTVLNSLADALTFCGYYVMTGVDFNSQFNIGFSVLADMTMFDDLTSERLVLNLSARDFNSAISNGRFTVEDKGKDKKQARSRTVMLGNANHWQPEKLYEIEDGAKSRFTALSAYEAPKGKNPYQMTERVANEMGIDPLGIWLRILRDCYDTALPYCSVNQQPPQSENNTSINDRIDYISLSNKNYFDSNPGLTFLILCFVALCVRKGVQVTYPRLLRSLDEGIRETNYFFSSILCLHQLVLEDNNEEWFVRAIAHHWADDTNKRQSHPFIGLRELRHKSLMYAHDELRALIRSQHYRDDDLLENDIETIISVIRNKRGMIRKSYIGINKDWEIIAESKTYRDFIGKVATDIEQFENGVPETIRNLPLL